MDGMAKGLVSLAEGCCILYGIGCSVSFGGIENAVKREKNNAI